MRRRGYGEVAVDVCMRVCRSLFAGCPSCSHSSSSLPHGFDSSRREVLLRGVFLVRSIVINESRQLPKEFAGEKAGEGGKGGGRKASLHSSTQGRPLYLSGTPPVHLYTPLYPLSPLPRPPSPTLLLLSFSSTCSSPSLQSSLSTSYASPYQRSSLARAISDARTPFALSASSTQRCGMSLNRFLGRRSGSRRNRCGTQA